MNGNRGTDTKHQTTTTAPKPRDRRNNLGPGTRIIKALAEARRVRHHPNCNCRRFDGQFCNAMDALWTNAMNRELGQIRTQTP